MQLKLEIHSIGEELQIDWETWVEMDVGQEGCVLGQCV